MESNTINIYINKHYKSKMGAIIGFALFLISILFIVDKIINQDTRLIFFIWYLITFSTFALYGAYIFVSAVGVNVPKKLTQYIIFDDKSIEFKLDLWKKANIVQWNNINEIIFNKNSIDLYQNDSKSIISFEKLYYEQILKLKAEISNKAFVKKIKCSDSK